MSARFFVRGLTLTTFALGLCATGCSASQTLEEALATDPEFKAAYEACAVECQNALANTAASSLDNGPCLIEPAYASGGDTGGETGEEPEYDADGETSFVPAAAYSCDLVNDPRKDVDNDPANQCAQSKYRIELNVFCGFLYAQRSGEQSVRKYKE